MEETNGERSPKAASRDAAFAFLGSRSTGFDLAGKLLIVDCDEPAVTGELFVAFGMGRPAGEEDRRRAFLHVELLRASDDTLTLAIDRGGEAIAPHDIFFGLSHPDCPYRAIEESSGRTMLSFRDNDVVQFSFDDSTCHMYRTKLWPQAAVSAVMRIFRRCADDIIFIHSSAAGVDGRAALFVGAAGSGKSTIALALAARNHDLLSDEFGCYVPATGEVQPFRRPAGLRPGPRSAAVDAALSQGYRGFDNGESLRVDVASLLPLGPARALPLHAVVFLEGFAPRPSFRDIVAGHREVGMLAGADASLSDVPRARRTFDLLQLLARARVGYLKIGDPDETAILLEAEVLRS